MPAMNSAPQCVMAAARLGLLLFSILLVACARPALQPEEVVFTEAGIPENWLLDGRIGLQLPDRSWQAAIHWNQHGEDFEISLRGPFGQGLGRVQKQGKDVVLTDGEGRTLRRSASELDHLVTEQLGVPVPIGSLRYWVLGRPRPGRSWRLLDSSQGRRQGFSQVGWDIRFDNWSSFDGRMLPARLTMRRDAVRLRLVLHEWAATSVEHGAE
ncbi:MAG TPA: outer membrane lipoprotein LolB [Sedimenticola sp.]|nr:outer membrane lipoprotein LolB [Sedimenticola sp.]